MLSFFRINDPYRLLFVLLLLLLIRLPYFIVGMPLTVTELHWSVVGEAMAAGSRLYVDIWDDIGPLSGVAYQLLFVLFGKARWPYYTVSVLLVIVQAGLFNQVLLRNKAYKENTYVPAFFYMVFMNASFDFVTLPPLLFSLTFILLATNNIFRRIDNTTQDELFLYTGLYLGTAGLFYLPLFPFLVSTVLALALFTGSILRRFLLLLFGFAVTIAIAYTYYYWYGGVKEFHQQFVASLWTIDKRYVLSTAQLLWVGAASLAVLLVSLFRIYTRARFANYQAKFQQVMVMNILAGLATLSLSPEVLPQLLIIFVPPVAFFASHYILEIRRRLWAEIFGLLIVMVVIGWGYALFLQPPALTKFVSFDNYYVQTNLLPEQYRGKKVWVAGNNDSYYFDATLGSKYLDWDLSEAELNGLDYYFHVENVAANLMDTRPDVIVDLEGVMPGLLEKVPQLEQSYRRVPGTLYYELID